MFKIFIQAHPFENSIFFSSFASVNYLLIILRGLLNFVKYILMSSHFFKNFTPTPRRYSSKFDRVEVWLGVGVSLFDFVGLISQTKLQRKYAGMEALIKKANWIIEFLFQLNWDYLRMYVWIFTVKPEEV